MTTHLKATMKCQDCVAEGERSRVYLGSTVSTAMAGGNPWYDEDGRRHVHDPNRVEQSASCSRGHTWTIGRRALCPTCGHDWRSRQAPEHGYG